MPTIESLVALMKRNPAGVAFSDALRVAEYYFGPPRIRGSHHFFQNPMGRRPTRKPTAHRKACQTIPSQATTTRNREAGA